MEMGKILKKAIAEKKVMRALRRTTPIIIRDVLSNGGRKVVDPEVRVYVTSKILNRLNRRD